jgi:TRAP-type C4-dicarboxylate transport system permease small subunit
MSEQPAPTPRQRLEEIIFIKIPYVVSGTLFLAAALLNVVNIVARYFFGKPIFWAEEALIFIMIWAVFVVVISITYRGGHLSMDLVYNAFGSKVKIAVNIVITITLLGCICFTALQSWRVLVLHYRNHGMTAGTDIPLVVPHAAVFFGFVLMGLAVLVRLRNYITGKFD